MLERIKEYFKQLERLNFKQNAKIIEMKIQCIMKHKYNLLDIYEDLIIDDVFVYARYSDNSNTKTRINENNSIKTSYITDIFFKGLIIIICVDDEYFSLKFTSNRILKISNIQKITQLLSLTDLVNSELNNIFALSGVDHFVDFDIINIYIGYQLSFKIDDFISVIKKRYSKTIQQITKNFVKFRYRPDRDTANLIEITSNTVEIKISTVFDLQITYKFMDNLIEELEKEKYGIN